MNNQKTIVILCIIILILIVCIAMLSVVMLKEESELAIADKTIYEGDSIVVVLTDTHGIGLSNATINIKLTDEDGVTTDDDITTDSKGKAKLKVEEAGKYTVDCAFNGEGKYSACSISDSIEVEKATTELVSVEQTSTTHSSKYAPNGGIYPEYGPEVDSYGTTREYAIANDMHYIEMTLDDGETVGGYTAIDPNTGYYHT